VVAKPSKSRYYEGPSRGQNESLLVSSFNPSRPDEEKGAYK
jgi:hypothetical protein